ncbi:RNA polymerase sigma factor [Aquabacterium sp. A7-Y]|uniref:RNA polymerase sigma factor n=1 Tax=Aquabacterium sp. A7-Y TaxID=1349605 RepID=UPI00223CFD67|nr:RNA polymerase sigma factor [Aquabacterium sp. A7-Y]MCW7536973.1 RNA polymerase sigma factor [Aquabacterium sp. A7-Y]
MNKMTDFVNDFLEAAHAGPEADAQGADTSAGSSSLDVSALYRAHRQHVFLFVLRRLGSPEDAEDVTQATFVEALRCAHRFSGLSKPSTWLFGIALNMARSHVRKHHAEHLEDTQLEAFENVADPLADPMRAAETREIARLAQDLIQGLPQRVRTTLESVIDEGHTYQEAARRQGVPIGTVRSRVSRVRESLRAAVDG